MKAFELPMRGLGDTRLAVHAAGALPAWLWSIDGTRILWANPVGVRVLDPRSSDLDSKVFGPADARRRQVVQLATRLLPDGPVRLERLRGFGATLGRLVTCACSRLTLADGGDGLLVVVLEPLGRPMPLSERLQRLVEDAESPLAAFGRDGVFVGASRAARALLGFRDLTEAGLDAARDDALRDGRAKIAVGFGHLVLQRVGSGADIGLIALLEPDNSVPKLPTAAVPFVAPPQWDELSDFDEDEPDAAASIALPEDVTGQNTTFDDSPGHDEPAHDDELAEQPPAEPLPRRTLPLRFLWEIDAREHFRVSSDELLRLLGPQSAATLDAPWRDVAAAYAPYGRMAAAIASRAAWSGISLALPADSADELLIADLSGIPAYDNGEFAGYRGFGVVDDLDALTDLEALRQREERPHPAPHSLSAHTPFASPMMDSVEPSAQKDVQIAAPDESPDHSVDTPPNVVLFRASADGRSPALTPVENSAFDELARELSARLEAEPIGPAPEAAPSVVKTTVSAPDPDSGARRLLDLAPVAMLVLREGQVVYTNAAYREAAGYDDGAASNVAFDPSALGGTVRQVAVDWDGESAEALIWQPEEALAADPVANPEAGAAADAEDLGAILDAADQAILMIDAGGTIRASNLSAAALLGAHGDDLVARAIAGLFTPDTQDVAASHVADLAGGAGEAQTFEARAPGRHGIDIPLRITVGRARPDGPNFYAILRDISPLKASEAELAQARRQSERAVDDKADILARISHELRAPLTAIIGFADVMIEQRFGPLGNDRYADYLRDIRGCGERVVAIVDDLLDLSRIESGRRDLAPAPQDLNDLVEQCVAAMQPQANRERIIIRSSLAHPLPHVVADGASLRQIALNLIGNSIHLANPGGQIIVSTARTEGGDVLLRVRDTGHGLNDNEVATALAPFRPGTGEDAEPAAIRLSLTRALAEANHARFSVRPAPYAGTLIEVAFPADRSRG